VEELAAATSLKWDLEEEGAVRRENLSGEAASKGSSTVAGHCERFGGDYYWRSL
jgi:hypothetical protein